MKKRKGRFEGNTNFLSNLPLEECVFRLQTLENEDLRLAFSVDGQDSIIFQAHLLERGIVRAEGKGRLRRWEGTLTRVDCDVEVREGIIRWLILLATVFLITMVATPMVFFMAAGVNFLTWALVSAGIVIFFVSMMLVSSHFAPMDDTPRNLLYLITSTLDE